MANLLDPNFNYKFTIKSATEAIKWFRQKIQDLKKDRIQLETTSRKINQRDLLASFPVATNNVFQTGKMYLFNYDPINRKTLPYYDTFPLILLTDINKDGFFGINLHYLPVEQRMVFLSNIVPQKGMYQEGQLQRLYMSYDSIKDIQEFQFFKPCFKKYLTSRVRSQIRLIPVDDWGYAAALPIESFKKETKQKVWRDSMATQDMTL